LRGKIPDKKQAELMARKIKVIDSIRPVYSDTKYDLYDKKYEWIPFGLYYELRSLPEKELTSQEYKETRDKVWQAMKLPMDKDKRIAEGNLTIASIPLEYAQALVGHSQKLIEYSLIDDAKKYLELAIRIAPTSDTAQASLGSLYLVKRNDCKSAIPYIKKAIELKPVDKKYYFYLYTAYLGCGNKMAVEDLSQTFSKLFDQEIFNSFKNAASESGSAK
jgi:tetratricopeptide (TPR) repeat protein